MFVLTLAFKIWNANVKTLLRHCDGMRGEGRGEDRRASI